MESSRRQDAQESLGLTSINEEKQQQEAIDQELLRQQKKIEKQQQLEESSSYMIVKGIKTVMDDYYVDPILGWILPGVGDIITSVMVIPYVWVALFKIKSFPLTLAVIYNVLVDIMLGLIPFWVGNIIDIFYKSYKKNYTLIVGYVEDNQSIIREVNGKAIKMVILIAIVCVIIYYLVKLVSSIVNWFMGLF